MTNGEFSEREVALLLEITRLQKKYGPETFKSLADSLADPEWPARLTIILDAAVTTGPQSRAGGSSKRRPSASERIGAQLKQADPEHLSLLRPVVARLVSGEALPRLKDVAEFNSAVGLPVPKTKSRSDAVASLVRMMLKMPINELEKIIHEFGSATPGVRSLEGWNDIIERSRAETTDRQVR